MARRVLPAFLAVLAVAAILPAPALAHMVSADVGDFYAGLLHPLSSAEHLLAVLAVAFLAAQCGSRAGRLAVVLVPLGLVAGILAGLPWPMPLAAYLADAAGLVVVGGLIVAAPGVPPAVVALCATAMGLVLGWRSGGDWAASRAGWQFVPGVAVAGFAVTALVAAWVPRLVGGWRGAGRVLVGAAFAGYGVVLLGLGLASGGGGGLRLPRLPDGTALREFLQYPVQSPAALMAALALAVAWGAAHALTPGHGKALVGAYLVGSRGTWRQAVWLGLTVTATHTLGVFVLGLVAVLAVGRVEQERLFPWLTLASGLGMLGVGGALVLRGLPHDGDEAGHAHSHGGHSHSHGGSVPGELGWRSLFALGVSGGLAPCPSALALMLGAIALGRVELGLALVAAFGLGLAGVLTAVGLLCLKGARVLEGAGALGRAVRWLPLVGAGLVAAIGALVVCEALAGLGWW